MAHRDSSRWQGWTSAVALFLAAVPVIGGEPPAERGAAEIFDSMTVVASKVEEKVRDVAGTVSVIERQALELRLVQGAADVVRHEPGVSSVGQAGRFGFSSFRIRGVDGNRVGLEVDGVPVADTFAVGSFANAGRDAVDPELLQSVEILRGPASALHGSDALGGVVVLTTRSPVEFLAGAGDAASARASADGRDRGWRTSLTGASARGGWQVLGVASVRQGHEAGNVGDTPADPATSDDRSVLAHLVRPSARGAVELLLDRREIAVATDVRHLVHGAGQFATTERLLADDRVESSRAVLQHRFDNGRGWLAEGRSRLFWSGRRTVQETMQERAADARTPERTRRERRFELGEERLGGEWTATSLFTTRAVAHRLVWGIEAEAGKIHELRDGRETRLATGATTRVVLGESLPVRDFPLSSVRHLAIYAADSFDFGDGRWRLQPALRFERSTNDAHADRLYREDFPETPVVDLDDSSWTPKLALTRAFGAGDSVYLQYAEGFRAPPFSDVNIGLRITTFNYQAIPNPELRPERSRGAELGWRHAGARWSAHVALFDNRYVDLIESRANLGLDPLTGMTLFQSINRDRARIYGAESRLRLDIGSFAPAARGLTVDTTFSWTRGEDTRRRQPLNTIDPARWTLDVAYAAASGRWSTSVVGSWVRSKLHRVDTSTADVFAPPGYALLDLYGEWRPRPPWSMTVALLNALDRKYWSFGTVRGVLDGDPQRDFYTQPGRALLLGVAWRR
jgi:hemoglobin/transferrin/lactoferrin receptor protein